MPIIMNINLNSIIDLLLRKKIFYQYLLIITTLAIVLFFYWPESNIFESRYVYYADSFERAATKINPDYDNYFFKISWENLFPLHTLLAQSSVILFQNNLFFSILFVNIGIVLLACILFFFANLYFFSYFQSFIITLLFFCGRTTLPIARGLGVISPQLLIPFFIFFIVNLAKTQNNTFKKKKME